MSRILDALANEKRNGAKAELTVPGMAAVSQGKVWNRGVSGMTLGGRPPTVVVRLGLLPASAGWKKRVDCYITKRGFPDTWRPRFVRSFTAVYLFAINVELIFTDDPQHAFGFPVDI